MDRFLGMRVGPYELVRRLGAGGMGAVYLGHHPTIGSRVAIKILHRRYLEDAAVVRRFIEEARLVNQIDHPGIVRVFDCDRRPEVGLYLVMELLEGETLHQRFRKRAPRPGELVPLLLQVADALTAAHAIGIIHRDLKPSNIFLVRDAAIACGVRAKLLDFGVAKLIAGHGGTTTGAVLGTPSFMSPEQLLDSRNVDGRSDVYALGVTAYFLVARRSPFGLDPRSALSRMIAPPALVGVPDELSAIVTRALASDREQRFPSMAAFAEALRRHAGTALPEGGLSVAATAALGVPDAPTASLAEVSPRRTLDGSAEGPLTELATPPEAARAGAPLTEVATPGPGEPQPLGDATEVDARTLAGVIAPTAVAEVIAPTGATGAILPPSRRRSRRAWTLVLPLGVLALAGALALAIHLLREDGAPASGTDSSPRTRFVRAASADAAAALSRAPDAASPARAPDAAAIRVEVKPAREARPNRSVRPAKKVRPAKPPSGTTPAARPPAPAPKRKRDGLDELKPVH